MSTKPSISDLAIWWAFEANGNDSHTGENHLTEYNNPSYVAAKVGNGVDIEWDSGQYFEILKPHDGMVGGGDFTVTGWLKGEEWREKLDYTYVYKAGNTVTTGGILLRVANEVGGDAFGHLACTLYAGDGVGGHEVTIHGDGITAGNWYFFAYVHDYTAKSVKIIGDATTPGTLVQETSLTYSTFTPTNPNINAQVARGSAASGDFFDGIIDELTIWNAALSVAEIEWLHELNSYADLTASGSTAAYNKVDLSLGVRL